MTTSEKEIFKINEDLTPIFNKLKEYFEEFSKDDFTDKDNERMFLLLLKATIVKSYEFSLATISLRGENIFFMLPALRGICEEHITEKFLFETFPDIEERNFIVTVWQQHGILKSSIAQWEYFKVKKSSQTLYYEDSFPDKLQNLESEIKKHFKRKLPTSNFKSTFPTVHYMAKATELLELYNYLYHATSTFVHFHPQNLFRMGWGNIPECQFSTSHFKHYYNYFLIYYGALLFCELIEWQVRNGYLIGFDSDSIKPIREILNGISRSPELVTFEEMNIGVLSRHLFYKSPGMVSNGVE